MDVSVVVPFCNPGASIERCARALFGQTLREGVEFVFVDDGSSDGAAELIDRALEKRPDRRECTKVVRMDENAGALAARFRGLDCASGRYTAFCDADDEPEPGLYEAMLSKAVESGADIVVSPMTVVWPDGEARVDAVYPDVDSFFEAAFHTSYFNAFWNKLFRREILASRGFSMPTERIDMAEDLLVVSQALLRCRSIAFSRGPSYRYIMSDASACNKWNRRRVTDQVAVANALAEALPEKYRGCVMHLRHRIQSNVLRFGGVAASEYAALWPKERSFNSLSSDGRLHFGTSSAIWLSSFSPSAAMCFFRTFALLRDSVRRRKRDV